MKEPLPLEVKGPGPFVTPVAEGCLGLVIRGGRLPVQIHLVLSGGHEFLIPLSDLAYERLIKLFSGLSQERPTAPQQLPLIVSVPGGSRDNPSLSPATDTPKMSVQLEAMGGTKYWLPLTVPAARNMVLGLMAWPALRAVLKIEDLPSETEVSFWPSV